MNAKQVFIEKIKKSTHLPVNVFSLNSNFHGMKVNGLTQRLKYQNYLLFHGTKDITNFSVDLHPNC